MINIIFNCETADPDDMLTLCMLSHHPKVNLIGVTVTPGSIQQTSLVKDILHSLNRPDVIVGARNPLHPKSCVSEFHNKWLGNDRTLTEYETPILGEDVIAELASQYENIKIVSGAALSCVARYLTKYQATLGEVVVQGGFAGDSVVPEEYRLEKFKGRETCPTFNLNADVEAAKLVVDTQQIKLKRFVSKNVCHGIIYDQEMHERIKPHRNNNPGLKMMVEGMQFYLKNKPSGKAFHDPLAACVAIDPTICKYAEVEIYREKGEWGARNTERNGVCSDTFITIAVDREKFEQVLVGI
jgi:inosine-uridine nucleoside N-ribohydrolase